MYSDGPIFETVDHHVIVWGGDLTPDELDAFLDESCGCADDEPHSEFMREIGKWCDHDFLWAEALPAPRSIDDLIAANGIDDDSLVHELQTRAIDVGNVQSLIGMRSSLNQRRAHETFMADVSSVWNRGRRNLH